MLIIPYPQEIYKSEGIKYFLFSFAVDEYAEKSLNFLLKI